MCFYMCYTIAIYYSHLKCFMIKMAKVDLILDITNNNMTVPKAYIRTLTWL